MDTFENANPPQEQPEMVLAGLWKCGRTRVCHERIGCRTGTHIHTRPDCRAIISRAASGEDSTALSN